VWALPSIQKLNDEASQKEYQNNLTKQATKHLTENGEQATCDSCDRPATCSVMWYDIFSNDAKGVIHLCDFHEEYSTPEGFFYCMDCDTLLIENYTWEHYLTEEGLCLNCARERYLTTPENWIELTEQNIKNVDFDTIRKAKHVLAVGQLTPEKLEFLDNAEFDSIDGHQISGDSVQSILEQARTKGHKEAILILDAAYQFAVSIGVYVSKEKEHAVA